MGSFELSSRIYSHGQREPRTWWFEACDLDFSPTRRGEHPSKAKQSQAKQSALQKSGNNRQKNQKKKRVVVGGLVNPQPFFVVRFIL
jgi:hypothetical protein